MNDAPRVRQSVDARAPVRSFLLHGLWAVPGIDTRAAEEEGLLRPEAVGGIDHVVLDRKVVTDEIRRLGVIGDDAADLGRHEEYVGRAVLGEARVDRATKTGAKGIKTHRAGSAGTSRTGCTHRG